MPTDPASHPAASTSAAPAAGSVSVATPAKPALPAWRSRWVVCWALAAALALFGLDLYVKYWSFRTVAGVPVVLTRENSHDPDFWRAYPHDHTTLIPGVLALRLTTNRGAVFGIGQGKQWFFISVTVLAVGAIGWIFARSQADAWPTHLALVLILAGALGNFYDRVVYGVVRDMFLLFPGTRIFPWIFNVADVLLDAGVVLSIYIILFGQPRQDDGSPQG